MSTLAEPEVPTAAPSAVVEYSATEAALADLRSRYQNVVFDVATTKGDKAARAARLELVTLRTTLEKKRGPRGSDYWRNVNANRKERNYGKRDKD